MAEIKWIKITTDIFDDEKILLIESMPEADSMIVIWFKLLAFAGKSNNNGVFMLSNKIAYTDEMLATIFRRPLNTVRLALQTFEQFEMIEINDGIISISNWEKHQNVEGMDKIREQNRKRVAEHRERQKQQKLLGCNVTGNVTHNYSNGTEEDKEEEEDNEEEKKRIKDKEKRKEIDCQLVADLYNEICISFPGIRTLSDSRKKAIKARIHSGYTIDDFREIFTKAEESAFLKGKNDRNWNATFDWMIKDANAVKIMEGNYTDKKTQTDNKGKVVVNGKEYIFKNGNYYIPNGSGIAVDPFADDDLPF